MRRFSFLPLLALALTLFSETLSVTGVAFVVELPVNLARQADGLLFGPEQPAASPKVSAGSEFDKFHRATTGLSLDGPEYPLLRNGIVKPQEAYRQPSYVSTKARLDFGRGRCTPMQRVS